MKNYPVWRSVTKNQMFIARVLGPLNVPLLGMMLFAPLIPFLMVEYKPYNLALLNDQLENVRLPENTFQHRDSAHYIEVNKRYMFLMGEEMKQKYDQIAMQRSGLN